MISPQQSNLAEIRAEADLKKVHIKRKIKFDKSDKETQTEHLASLSFLMRHLNTVARSSVVNKMTSTNLAIVLSPNLLPVQDNLTVNQGQAKVDKKTVDLNSKKLKLHTDILEWMITHSDRVGYVTTNVMER